MSGQSKQNRETSGIEAPGPIDRALDQDRDDRIDVLEGGQRRSARDVAMGQGTEYAAGTEGEIRVPVVEEQLSVGKREVDLGEVEIRRRVVEEQQSVPVTLRHEEVTVQEVDTPDRPLRAGEDAFDEGVIRVAVHGEEAVVAKEAVVTGEVVVEKDVTQEQRTVSDTVRRTEVDFDEHYKQARGDFERHHASTVGTQGGAFEEHEQHYRTGFATGADQRYAGRQFEDVEPELRQGHETAGGGGGWERLREQVRTGFNRARGQ
jgi:uncharacterized protein (TIGR02271 family)